MDRRRSIVRSTRPSSSISPVARGYTPSPASGDVVTEWETYPDLFGEHDDSGDSDSDACEYYDAALAKRTSSVLRTPVTINPEDLYLVSVDGYYRRRETTGGYGVILRCGNGQPIAAVAGNSDRSISGFYHTLEGVQAGFLIAIKYNINYVQMVCNADWVYWIVKQCFQSNRKGHCRAHPEGSPSHHFDVFCVTCFKMTTVNADFFDNFRIMKEIVELGKRYYRIPFITSVDRGLNEPADFLAKFNRQYRIPGVQIMLEPHRFPGVLISLLSKFGGELPFDLA